MQFRSHCRSSDEISGILVLETGILGRILVILRHTKLWKLLALEFQILLPSMTGVLTLCFYLKSHIISVTAHNLLEIRQDRLTKHKFSFGNDYKNQDSQSKETFCQLQWKSFRSALALKKVRRRTCCWDLWAHVWPLLCSWSDGVDISKCTSESESRSSCPTLCDPMDYTVCGIF